MTLGYEYIKPLNENMFLSTRTGVNGFVYLFSVGIGVPHGVSINFGKKHVYFETGLNGWYGFTDNGEMNGDGFSYVTGMNLGLNAALGAKYPKVVYRIYANPWYNPTSNNGLFPQTFIWAGMGLSVRLHD
jgi:hypothetical protein